jgi:hypothetical protein
VVAWVLVLLAASPFTAPFSTCDLSALVDGPQIGAKPSSSAPQRRSVAVGHGDAVVAAFFHESLKDVAAPVVARLARGATTHETSVSISTRRPLLRLTPFVLRL